MTIYPLLVQTQARLEIIKLQLITGFITTKLIIKVSNADAIVDFVPVATDLFISEYIEGSSNNKVIELYNGTGTAINLSNYSVKIRKWS